MDSSIVECLPLIGCEGDQSETNCIQRIEQSIVETFAEQGFDSVRYTSVQIVVKDDLIVPSFSINLSTFPPEWDKLYEDKEYAVIDPVYWMLVNQENSQRVNFGSWHDIEQAALEDLEKYSLKEDAKSKSGRLIVYEGYEQHGLNSGLYIILADEEGRTIIHLASKMPHEELAQRLNDTYWKKILGMIIHINYAIEGTRNCSFCDKHLRIAGGETVVINPQQIEILKCYLDNPKATAKSVAEKVFVSESTINYHLKEIRKKFSMPETSGLALAQFAHKHRLL